MENTQRLVAEMSTPTPANPKSLLPIEVWKHFEGDLWLGPKNVIINSAALEERKYFYNIVQLSQGQLWMKSNE